MSKETVPTIGQPIFTLTQNNWSDKIKVTQGFSSVNTLAYIAVNAVKCMSVGYVDDKMEEIVINKDYKDIDGHSVAIVMNAGDKPGRKKSAIDIFLDEEEANAVAIGMNQQFKQECKEILDVVSMVYHEYDNLNGALKAANKK
jgi:hypothetical protein